MLVKLIVTYFIVLIVCIVDLLLSYMWYGHVLISWKL